MRRHHVLAVLVVLACGSGSESNSVEPAESVQTADQALRPPAQKPRPPVGLVRPLPWLRGLPAARASASVSPRGAARLEDVRSVQLSLAVKSLPGRPSREVPVTLEIETPDGTPYQRMEGHVSFAGGLRMTTFDVPVAGTLIQQARLSGRWTARFLVNGQPLATTVFALP